MAAPAPIHADRGYGRTYTAADRCRSGETSTDGRLTHGHLKLHPNLHPVDGRSLGNTSAAIVSLLETMPAADQTALQASLVPAPARVSTSRLRCSRSRSASVWLRGTSPDRRCGAAGCNGQPSTSARTTDWLLSAIERKARHSANCLVYDDFHS